MKQKFILALVVCCILVSGVSAASSQWDSLTIEEDILEIISYDPNGLAFRLYTGAYMWGFADHKEISELLEEPYTSEIRYVRESGGVIRDYKIEDGIAKESDWIRHQVDDFFDAVSRIDSIISVLGEDVTVENIYCLDGEPNLDGIYIYFVTNQGDYVYYKDYTGAEDEYLIPLAQFYEFAEVFYQNQKNAQYGNGTGDIEELYDLDGYNLKTYTGISSGVIEEPIPTEVIIIGVAACVVMVAVIAICVRKKRM